MKRTPFKRKPPKHDPEHAAATALAATSACLLCGSSGTCVPAHFPRHRGSGGRWKHPWARKRWVPACGEPGACHDMIDGRAGSTISGGERLERIRAALLAKAHKTWWTDE